MLQSFSSRLRSLPAFDLARRIKWSVDEWRASRTDPKKQVVSLPARGPSRGTVLFSYIIDGFLLNNGQPVPATHTNIWASLQMARTFCELGFAVDVISHRNHSFVPDKSYTVFVDVRRNLERLAPLLNDDCMRIMHVDTAHILFHNAAEAKRLLDLQHRRGITLRPMRHEMPNLGIEHADCATTTGNEWTISTFAYAKKPFYRVPIPVVVSCPWPSGKDFESCRNTFLWFSSGGLVHKGLDLALEAFAGMPEYRLIVCCPIDREPQFAKAYHRELYETANISTVGWIGVNTPVFQEIATQCVGLVYVSCSEGGGACVVTSMHAGLIPIVTRETSVDIHDFGFPIGEASIEEIRNAVRQVASRPVDELRERSRKVWEYATTTHTRDNFARQYRQVINDVLSQGLAMSQARRQLTVDR